jgi:hypothetical protein
MTKMYLYFSLQHFIPCKKCHALLKYAMHHDVTWHLKSEYWSQRSVAEVSSTMQQLDKTCFHGNKYAHNSTETAAGSIFYLSYAKSYEESQRVRAMTGTLEAMKRGPGQTRQQSGVARLQESWDTKIWSWVPWDSEPLLLFWWDLAAIYLTWPDST